METNVASPESSKAATPLMQQYLGIKERYPDEILFFRLGDFYEMFFEDAIKAAPLLEVALTQRQSVPMCGVPYHAATGYLSKLIKAGVSVAIAEQLEEPKNTKGMVKRDVVRVVTPGTLVEDELLSSKANNFLVAVALVLHPREKKNSSSPNVPVGGDTVSWALAAADVSTGRQWLGECEDDFNLNALRAHLTSLSPSEILVVGADPAALNGGEKGLSARLPAGLLTGRLARFVPVPPEAKNLKGQALQAIRSYLQRDHAEAVKSLQEPLPLPTENNGVMFLDETAIRHLELVNPADPLRPGPTLFSILDRCVTSIGSRKLRWWILHPLLDIPAINARLAQVEGLVQDSLLRDALRTLFNGAADIERISVRTQAGSVSPRDLEALRHTLHKLPKVRELFAGPEAGPVPLHARPPGRTPRVASPGLPPDQMNANVFSSVLDQLFIPSELLLALDTQLSDEPSAKLVDGGVIREGYNRELDDLRKFRRSGKKWIAEMEAAERERTGIGSLKVGYNDVFGYYLEVSRTNLGKVPADWIRKQTLANGERYITPALKEQEEKILGAEEKIVTLESRLYTELVHQVAAFGPTLAKIADGAAHLDAVSSLAQVAAENGFTRPTITGSDELRLFGARHPVVERQIGRDRFIPNDVELDQNGRRIAVITGPNMAGKSTYLRQTALIAIMAQMGSFVPAQSATIGVVDKIFTRIGASDRLSQGQSTFMVEMQEVATLIRNCTARSLLILDEVGRGTSTYDGVSIAWAVIEHLVSLKPRTLFATHYFELTQLEGKLNGVFNAHATAKEWPGPDGRKQVVFLYQILPGPADRSYGIHVAEMAGLPDTCIRRAREMLKQLESGNHELAKPPAGKGGPQLELFGGHPVIDELKSLSLDKMTPLEALNHLAYLKKLIGEEEKL